MASLGFVGLLEPDTGDGEMGREGTPGAADLLPDFSPRYVPSRQDAHHPPLILAKLFG